MEAYKMDGRKNNKGISSYACSCGNLKGVSNRGILCDECNSVVSKSFDRSDYDQIKDISNNISSELDKKMTPVKELKTVVNGKESAIQLFVDSNKIEESSDFEREIANELALLPEIKQKIVRLIVETDDLKVTKQQMADEIGITRQTLHGYLKDERVISLIAKCRARELKIIKDTNGHLKAQGETKGLKLLMEIIDDKEASHRSKIDAAKALIEANKDNSNQIKFGENFETPDITAI
jgi:transcriptional regulator with XRE-family HTH domain